MKGILVNKTQKKKLSLSDTKTRILGYSKNGNPIRKQLCFAPLIEKSKIIDFSNSIQARNQNNFQKGKLNSKKELVEQKTVNKLTTSRIRPFSSSTKLNELNKSKTRLMSVSKADSKNNNIPESQCKLSGQNKYSFMINELIDKMKQNFIIIQNNMQNYSIKRQHLIMLLNYIISILTAKPNNSKLVHQQFTQFHFISDILHKIIQINQSTIIQQYTQIHKNYCQIISYKYDPKQYQEEVDREIKELENLMEARENVQQIMDNLYVEREKVTRELHEGRSAVLTLLKQKMDLQENIKRLKERERELMADVNKHELQIQQIKRKGIELANFCSNQNIQKMTSFAVKQLKQNEEDMHMLANQLNSNYMASSLEYLPVSFSQITRELVEEMKNVNKIVMFDRDISLGDKFKAMRDFMVKSMDRFKTKDEEMVKLAEFKTKCIIKFIEAMKKWKQNCIVKGKFLESLRLQFCIDGERFMERIDSLKKKQERGQFKESEIEIMEIQDIFRKLECNYKIGNAFF